MSKAKDNTQLSARFGFNDPDRNNHKHNRAPLFIKENALDIIKNIYSLEEYKLKSYECDCGNRHDGEILNRNFVDVEVENWTPEYVLTKGTGQYKTTIGFIDLLLEGITTIQGKLQQWKVIEWKEETMTFRQAKMLSQLDHLSENKCVSKNDAIFSKKKRLCEDEEKQIKDWFYVKEFEIKYELTKQAEYKFKQRLSKFYGGPQEDFFFTLVEFVKRNLGYLQELLENDELIKALIAETKRPKRKMDTSILEEEATRRFIFL